MSLWRAAHESLCFEQNQTSKQWWEDEGLFMLTANTRHVLKRGSVSCAGHGHLPKGNTAPGGRRELWCRTPGLAHLEKLIPYPPSALSLKKNKAWKSGHRTFLGLFLEEMNSCLVPSCPWLFWWCKFKIVQSLHDGNSLELSVQMQRGCFSWHPILANCIREGLNRCLGAVTWITILTSGSEFIWSWSKLLLVCLINAGSLGDFNIWEWFESLINDILFSQMHAKIHNKED